MAFRKMKQKKYDGISEYYNPKSNDKATISYYLIYRDINDKPIKIKAKAKNPDDAKKELEDIKHQILKDKKSLSKEQLEQQRAFNLNRATIDNVAELFFKNRTAKNNIKDKQAYYNRVSKIIGSKKVSNINDDDIKKLRNHLKNNLQYSPKTINETFNVLRAMFNEGMKPKNKWCNSNPIVDLDIERETVSNEVGRILNDEELEMLFNVTKNGSYDLELAPKPTLFLFLQALYYTGARPQSVLDLQVQNINFHNNTIYIKPLKKGNGYYQKVNDKMMSQLKEWIGIHKLGFDDFIFYPQQIQIKSKPMIYESISRTSKPYFNKLFNEKLHENDKNNQISFYSLRRTAGTKIYKAKGILEAMVFLNHTSVKTTQKYLNVKSENMGGADVL